MMGGMKNGVNLQWLLMTINDINKYHMWINKWIKKLTNELNIYGRLHERGKKGRNAYKHK